ncbi:MAG: CopG family ribbon-helix-helix protein [Actinomycetota bacterium]
MEIPLTPELEARLQRVAAATGRGAEEIVGEVVKTYLEHDQWFRNEVQKGLQQLEQGESFEHDDVAKRLQRLFHP